MLRALLAAVAALSAMVAADVTSRRLRRRRHRLLAATAPPPPGVESRLDAAAPTIRACIEHTRDDCTFCLGAIRVSSRIRVTPCRHVFHDNCLEAWVYHCADECLDWTNYSVGPDGHVHGGKSPPNCPNCCADLGVLMQDDLKQTILTSIARAMSLRDVSSAAELYHNGIVGLRVDDGSEPLISYHPVPDNSQPAIPPTRSQLPQPQPLQQLPPPPAQSSSPLPPLQAPVTAGSLPTRQEDRVHQVQPAMYVRRAALAFSGPASGKSIRSYYL
jgi:RING-like zinc finger